MWGAPNNDVNGDALETMQFEATQAFDAYHQVAEVDAQTPSPPSLPASMKALPKREDTKAHVTFKEVPDSSGHKPPHVGSGVVQIPEVGIKKDELDEEARFFVFHVQYVNPKCFM